MPKTLHRSLTPAEFHACVPLVPQLSPERVSAARAVLVDDEKQVEVANRYGITRQAVNGSVKAMWEIFQSYQAAKQIEVDMTEAALPPGWRVATVAAPGEMLDRLRVDAAAAAAAAAAGIEC
ncbi:TrfB-related DNA-binding protein [Massilia putida]|uniref:TrfB-related DNA-binding protein n=1 Tax=Massilia putida TaxID=1141883 RepID=UPI000952430C|nr:TrfB-related DNA-binding protein [Massilia putida]